MRPMSSDEQVSARSTLDHLLLLVAKRDRLNSAIDDAAEALVAQVSRAEWTPSESVDIWEATRKLGVKALATKVTAALGARTWDLVRWRDFPDVDPWKIEGDLPDPSRPRLTPGGPDWLHWSRGLPPNGKPCVYLLLDEQRRCLYVGFSVKVRDRLKSHVKEGRIPARRFNVIPQASREDAWRLEGDLIFQHQPPFNRAGRSARRVA